MEASTPASWPAHTCKDPAACWTSFFAISIINFPAIRRITSPTPIGRIPGFLLREIKQSAMNASRKTPTSLIDVFKYLVQSVLVKLTNNFRRSKEEDPNDMQTKILRQFSASNPDGPQSPFVFNAAFDISALSIAS